MADLDLAVGNGGNAQSRLTNSGGDEGLGGRRADKLDCGARKGDRGRDEAVRGEALREVKFPGDGRRKALS